MNEKEIIENCNVIFDNLEDMMSEESAEDYRESYRQFKDLYNKEKEKNKELTDITQTYNAMVSSDDPDDYIVCFASAKYFNNGYYKNNFVSKDKIKQKIEEYKNMTLFEVMENLPLESSIEGLSCARRGIVYVLKQLLEEK